MVQKLIFSITLPIIAIGMMIFVLITNLTNNIPVLTTSTTLMLSCFDFEVPLQSRMVSGVFWICSVPVVLNSQSLGGRGLV